jgi:hypothetical protein
MAWFMQDRQSGKESEREMNSSFPKPAPRTGILQRNYGFVHFATLDEPIFIREKTVHYSGSLKRGGSGIGGGGCLCDEGMGSVRK